MTDPAAVLMVTSIGPGVPLVYCTDSKSARGYVAIPPDSMGVLRSFMVSPVQAVGVRTRSVPHGGRSFATPAIQDSTRHPDQEAV